MRSDRLLGRFFEAVLRPFAWLSMLFVLFIVFGLPPAPIAATYTVLLVLYFLHALVRR